MINRFALSFLCIELDRNEIFRFFGLYILLTWLRFNYVQRNSSHELCVSRIDVYNFVLHNVSSCNCMNG